MSEPAKERPDRAFERLITSLNDLFAGRSTIAGGGCEPYSLHHGLMNACCDNYGVHATMILLSPPPTIDHVVVQHGITTMAEPTGGSSHE